MGEQRAREAATPSMEGSRLAMWSSHSRSRAVATDVVLVVVEDPSPSLGAHAVVLVGRGLDVAHHGQIAADVVASPGEPGQRSDGLQSIAREAGDELVPDHRQQIDPVLGLDEPFDLGFTPAARRQATQLPVLGSLAVAVGAERPPPRIASARSDVNHSQNSRNASISPAAVSGFRDTNGPPRTSRPRMCHQSSARRPRGSSRRSRSPCRHRPRCQPGHDDLVDPSSAVGR